MQARHISIKSSCLMFQSRSLGMGLSCRAWIVSQTMWQRRNQKEAIKNRFRLRMKHYSPGTDHTLNSHRCCTCSTRHPSVPDMFLSGFICCIPLAQHIPLKTSYCTLNKSKPLFQLYPFSNIDILCLYLN